MALHIRQDANWEHLRFVALPPPSSESVDRKLVGLRCRPKNCRGRCRGRLVALAKV